MLKPVKTAEDYNAQASVAAEYVTHVLMSRHRGALECGAQNRAAVFGNDGYGDPADKEPDDARARTEVNLFRQCLEDNEITELGFAVSKTNPATWAMIIEGDEIGDLEWVEEHLEESWRIACGIEKGDGQFLEAQKG